jgi:peroxiredoxin
MEQFELVVILARMIMNMNRTSWVGVTGILLFGLVVAGGCRSTPPPKAVDAQLAAQAKFLQDNSLAGQVVFIEFGAVGCELSGKGLAEMTSLDQKKAFPGLKMVRVEEGRDAKAVEEFYAKNKPPFPVVHDSDGAIAAAFASGATPQYLLVSKFGHIRFRGQLPQESKLREWSDVLAAEKSDPGADAPQFGQKSIDAALLLGKTLLPDLKGVSKALGEYKGNSGLLIVFVDTTCPFSAQAMKDMPNVMATMASQGVSSVLVNLDDNKETVQSFYADNPQTATVVYDVTTGTKNVWGVESVPTVMLVDAGGQLAYNGPAIWGDLGKAAEKSLHLPEGAIQFGVKGTGST